MESRSNAIVLKSRREIDLMRRAGALLRKVLDEVSEAVRPGVSTIELDRLAKKRIVQGGGKPSFLRLYGFPGTLCVSINEEVVHGIPSARRLLQEGDIISVDCGVNVKGWHADAAITVPEISIAEMRLQKAIDMPDILDRVHCLNLLNYPVIVSNYLRFFRLRDYLGRYTRKKVAFVLGIPNLITLFDDAYYEGLDGGIMGAFASLFDRETLLFVYPMRDADNPNQVITSETFPVPEKLKYFYRHLQANSMILPVEKYIDANLHIWPGDVLERMKKGPGAWEKDVPEVVAREIVTRCLFEYCSAT
jgi:hypothetical protein